MKNEIVKSKIQIDSYFVEYIEKLDFSIMHIVCPPASVESLIQLAVKHGMPYEKTENGIKISK